MSECVWVSTYLCRCARVSSMDRFVVVSLFCPSHFGCHLLHCRFHCPCPNHRHLDYALTSVHLCDSHYYYCCCCLNLMDCFDLWMKHWQRWRRRHRHRRRCHSSANGPHFQPPTAIVSVKYHGQLSNPVDLIWAMWYYCYYCCCLHWFSRHPDHIYNYLDWLPFVVAVAVDSVALIVVAAAVTVYSQPYRLDSVVHRRPNCTLDLCNALGVCLDRGSVCMPLMGNNHCSLYLDYCPLR